MNPALAADVRRRRAIAPESFLGSPGAECGRRRSGGRSTQHTSNARLTTARARATSWRPRPWPGGPRCASGPWCRCWGRRRGDRILAISHDVTAQRHLLDALREADRRKSDFIAVLSHELRNPLAAIRSGLYVLEPAGDG